MLAIATPKGIATSGRVETSGPVRNIKKPVVNRTLLAGFGIALCVSSGVLANDCANEAGGAAIAACFSARYSAADKELNRFYNSALSELSDSEKQKLVEAQRAWIKYRDAGVALVIEINKDARSYGSIVAGDYKATIVEKRVQEFKYILANPADPPVAW